MAKIYASNYFFVKIMWESINSFQAIKVINLFKLHIETCHISHSFLTSVLPSRATGCETSSHAFTLSLFPYFVSSSIMQMGLKTTGGGTSPALKEARSQSPLMYERAGDNRM